MTAEDTLRRQLDLITDPVVGGPSLSDALASGRSRRRRRRASAGLAGLAVAAAAGFAAVQLSDGSSAAPPAGDQPDRAVVAPDPSTPADFVPGSDIDELLQSVVLSHLGSAVGDAVTDVYPSDWTRDTPLPDSQADNATDWDALYQPSDTESLTVVMGYPNPHEPGDLGPCPGAGSDPIGFMCQRFEQPDGDSVLVQESSNLETGRFNLLTLVQRPNGFTVGAISGVVADSLQQSRQSRALSQQELLSVADDPSLHFPAPDNPPT